MAPTIDGFEAEDVATKGEISVRNIYFSCLIRQVQLTYLFPQCLGVD